MLNIFSLNKFSTFSDLKSFFVYSNFVLLWAIQIASFVDCVVISDSFDKYYPELKMVLRCT